MSSLTVTAKVQICPSETEKQLLDKTMQSYRDACNAVSDYIFRTHDLKQVSVNNAVYRRLRDEFAMRSQMAQSVIKTVIARYKTILENQREWIKPVFKKPQYDLVWNRDYSLNQERFSVNTLDGRIRLFYFKDGMEKYFDKDTYRLGTAKLVSKHGKYFLHIPVTCEIPESKLSDVCNIVGIDRGINFIVTAYDSKHKTTFISGKAVKQKRAHYKNVRKQLQQRQTPSSRRRLKAIGQRENRWMQDVNHCISKALVESNPEHTLFVLEDLENVRQATEKACLKNRYVSVSWSFYDLEQKLFYKAKQRQSSVIKVNPAYTSQCCPVCGHTEKANRNKRLHLFCCRTCGYKSNDDRTAAMNLYRMGINYLVPDTVITE